MNKLFGYGYVYFWYIMNKLFGYGIFKILFIFL